MHSAHELLTRWPALDVAGKRARLDNSLHASSGLADTVSASAASAERAASGLWQGDPSVWSPRRGGPEEDRQSARLDDARRRDGRRDRPGPGRSPRASGATDSPTSCCSAWAAPASRPKSSIASWVWRRAGRPFTCSTRPIPPASARRDTARTDAVYRREQIGHDHRTEFAGGAFPRAPRSTRCPAGRIISSPSPTMAPSWRDGRRRNIFATSSSTRRTSADGTRRSRSSGSFPRR